MARTKKTNRGVNASRGGKGSQQGTGTQRDSEARDASKKAEVKVNNGTMSKNGGNKKKVPNQPATASPEQLYATALTLLEQHQPEEALQHAQTLWQQVQHASIYEALPAVNLLGEICVEIGDIESAQAHFQNATLLDPEGAIPESRGGGAEKFLWLAQLCEEGGETSVRWYEKGARALQAEIAGVESGEVVLDGVVGGEEEQLLWRVEKKRKLANALCSIVEVYMTDLSWEEDAEARCEALITEAMAVEDETSPEVLQTLASVRLSQERKEDARAALTRSVEGWQGLDPEDPGVPDFPTRISLARLLMEAEMENVGMEVIRRLVSDDDESVEAWYLGGWCQFLLAEKLQTGDAEEEAVQAAMKGSRNWLGMALKLYERLEYEDERLFAHAEELVAGLNETLGPEEEDAEGAEGEWEEWGGIDDGEEGDGEEADADGDEEMKDS